MRPLTQEWLLEAWDRGLRQMPLDRALTMLVVACPERSRLVLKNLSIPERDLELLRLRRLSFGENLRALAACRQCGTSLEFDARISALLDRLQAVRPPAMSEWQSGEFSFSMRQATSEDLAAAASLGDIRLARWTLLKRCTTVRRTGEGGESEPVAARLEEAAIAKFEELHEGAEIVFMLPCPGCGRSERAELDIAQFLWTEVARGAAALLREVHELAMAYGWPEAAILGMSGARRTLYLEMVRA
jgi:hypothetical protein